MDTVGKDDVEDYSRNGKFSNRSKSVSISIPVSSNEVNSGEISHVSSTSPLYTRNHSNQSGDSNNENDGVLLVHGWAQETLSLLKKFAFGVMNPHDKYVEQLNKFFLISCLFAIFIDPLFFYLLSVKKDYKCVVINWPMAIILVVSRSITDFIYLMRILMEFKLAFISPESRVVGAGDLVKHHTKIALHYLSGFFFLDLLIVLPIPQMIVLFVQPNGVSSPGASYAKFLLQTVILIQYIPRLYRFLPLLGGHSSSRFIFESTWANFVINLLTFVLAGHVIGSCWYMLGLLRVNRCLRDSCHDSRIMDCKRFIDCGRGNDYVYRGFEGNLEIWNEWKEDGNSSACFSEDGFNYGIYMTAVNLTTESSFITRYVYSSFWGLQQISTLGGNQTPSYFVGEVLFTMGIIGLGLLLFALLIGNMQNFLQGLGRRRLEKSLRRRDVEEWMSHRRLPEMIRRKVRESERYHWAATRGVDEETLMENLPEDLQRDIRRHLFKFVKKVKIFALLDEPILDAICERLRQKTYIKGGTILYEGGFVTKMTFIVRGKMESIEKNGNNKVSLLEGDVCGEELLKWCLEDKRNQRKQGNRLLSKRTVKCLKNVEAFVLRAEDLEEVITLFDGFLKNVRVQFAIGNKSPYWQGVAASTIQVAWRYRKKRLSRARDHATDLL
ncbi:probable cyclic nucleotide-gated ion channel 20, chloroplastic [Lactuca sativa]|uniref:probable cyclic nucleotide-gated ion channel 20, chloroplastic n=1 Tax=Lactuca sativa TaxID=4236 RepID=UPI000CD94D4A|nr:probable cyclic nucleotide-gated ion channel 20, chloroplastic [Lactuca sativa]